MNFWIKFKTIDQIWYVFHFIFDLFCFMRKNKHQQIHCNFMPFWKLKHDKSIASSADINSNGMVNNWLGKILLLSRSFLNYLQQHILFCYPKTKVELTRFVVLSNKYFAVLISTSQTFAVFMFHLHNIWISKKWIPFAFRLYVKKQHLGHGW